MWDECGKYGHYELLCEMELDARILCLLRQMRAVCSGPVAVTKGQDPEQHYALDRIHFFLEKISNSYNSKF